MCFEWEWDGFREDEEDDVDVIGDEGLRDGSRDGASGKIGRRLGLGEKKKGEREKKKEEKRRESELQIDEKSPRY